MPARQASLWATPASGTGLSGARPMREGIGQLSRLPTIPMWRIEHPAPRRQLDRSTASVRVNAFLRVWSTDPVGSRI